MIVVPTTECVSTEMVCRFCVPRRGDKVGALRATEEQFTEGTETEGQDTGVNDPGYNSAEGLFL